MKWEKPAGSTQSTTDGRYLIMQANSQDWVAYDITLTTAAKDLGTTKSDIGARALCEAEEVNLMASLKRRA